MAGIEFAPGGLIRDEVVALAEGRFELQCLRMRLTQCVPEGPSIFEGPGRIWQGTDGRLSFSLYAVNRPYELLEQLIPLDDVEAGQLVADTSFYTLKMTDQRGRQWMSDQVLPKITGDAGNPAQGTFCSGVLQELGRTDALDFEVNKAVMYLRLLGSVNVAYNTTVESTTAIRGIGRVQTEGSLSALRLRSGDLQLVVRNDGASFVVEVTAGSPMLPSYIENRVIEALQFVSAQLLQWSVVTTYERDKGRTIRVRLTDDLGFRPKVQPPVHVSTFKSEPFCELLSRYLAHVIRYDGRGMHPLSGHFRAVLQASSGSITALARVLAVTIESLLLEMEAATDQLAEDETTWLEDLKVHVRNSRPPGRMLGRVMGSFGMYGRPHWSAALRYLVEKQVITEEQAKVTKDLRNRVAHGDTLVGDDLQSLTEKCSTMLVVLYRFVFYQIGYQGAYTDYSCRGWPESEFRC